MSGAKRSPWLWSGVAALLLPACYLLAQCVNDCKEVSYNINADGSCWWYSDTNCQVQANAVFNGNLQLTVWTPNPKGGGCVIVMPFTQIVASRNLNNTCVTPCLALQKPAEAGVLPKSQWQQEGMVFKYFCYQPPPGP
jgi:hypothetical protein